MNKETFSRRYRAGKFLGVYVTGITAMEGAVFHDGSYIPGLVAAGVIGAINAGIEMYKYRKFERKLQ